MPQTKATRGSGCIHLVGLLLWILLVLPADSRPAAAQTVTLVSRAASSPVPANGASSAPEISADGRFLVFKSTAGNLVPGQITWTSGNLPTNQVFSYDAKSGGNSLVSHKAGAPAVTSSGQTEIRALSGDGRWIAFGSLANDLILGLTGVQGYNTFLLDRVTGSLSLVSRASGGSSLTAASSHSGPAQLSQDGRYLLIASYAVNLIPGTIDTSPDIFDLFLYDRLGGTFALVSHASSSAVTTSNEQFLYAAMSADGRFVAYASRASNVIHGQAGGIFLYDRESGANTLVSPSFVVPPVSDTISFRSSNLSISADGSTVVFTNPAIGLVPDLVDNNAGSDVFAYDRATETTTLVSHASGSPLTAANGVSLAPSVSADGRWVAFQSTATDLVDGATLSPYDSIYLHDRSAGTTTLVSHVATDPAIQANGSSTAPALSADGRWIAFSSNAANVAAGVLGTLSYSQIYLYNRTAGTSVLVSHTPGSLTSRGNGVSYNPVLSSDGAFVGFLSYAPDLAPGDWNAKSDLFLYANPRVGLSFYTLLPCRVLDTRTSGDGPLFSGYGQILSLAGRCGIPSGARALALNATVTGASAAGFLSVYPGDLDVPEISSINFSAGQTRANNAIIPLALDGSARLGLFPTVAAGGTVHVMIDVVGYFQ